MFHISKSFTAILLIAASLFSLAGCMSSGSALEGTQWKLTGRILSSLNPADFTITAKFAERQVSGNSGVNTYSGSYKLGPGATFSVGLLADTLMAGPEPAMRAETAYPTLLSQVKSYKIADGELMLYDESGNVLLIIEIVIK